MDGVVVLPLNCVSLTISGGSCLVAVYFLLCQLRGRKPRDRFYDDADGRSSPRALATFSNKRIKSLILLFSAVGSVSSVGVLVLPAISNVEHDCFAVDILQATSWGLILVHATFLAILEGPVESHKVGTWLAASAYLLTIPSVLRLRDLTGRTQGVEGLNALLLFTRNLLAAAVGILSSSLPRRPDVLFHGKQVDRQWTVSLLNRLTWTWVEPLLRHASLHNDIDASDVPHPDSGLRSQKLAGKWDRLQDGSSLAFTLAFTYREKLATLWVATLIRCCVSILPFWFMLRVLKILEDQAASSSSSELLVLVVCMAISNLLDSWMEGWAYWHSMADLALPIRSQISGLIFAKALRRKNIRTATLEASDPVAEEDDTRSEDNSAPLQSRQAIVNLVGIDTERLSYFFQFHFLILNGVAKLVIFSIFLLRLLGWIPFVAGIIAWALTLPPNTWFSRRVLAESQTLMRHRDTKLSKINEVLLGMRQIKFSALEARWEQRILSMREAELKTLWKFFLADSGLFACWVMSPILLAVASLVTYVMLHGSLLPSVAFVSIGILNSLETTLGSLPELLTLTLDSLVSLRRLNVYLDEPERQTVLADGSAVCFEEAAISWPTSEQASKQHNDGFILSGLNFSFPPGKLSVISGKVGSGKSLLLSSIMGEADLLSGSIRVPRAQLSNFIVPNGDRWIIPGSIAYISQTPWLENASLRNNILFGLSFEPARYRRVIRACALEEDLGILPDGDATELGANGINLSGGQKWRVTLARAIYSRAEILLMEDIFSAVDSHVGMWIFERCLSGELCRGRTRILITHHLSLVLPRATFVVELGGGGLEYAGPPRVRNENRGKTQDPPAIDNQPDEGGGVVEDREENILPLQSPSIPKKFVQEEARQKGTVKGAVYMAYIRGSRSLYLWVACLGTYLAYQMGVIGRAWWLRIWTGETNVDAANTSLLGHPTYNMLFGTHHFVHQTTIRQEPMRTEVFFYVKVYVAISLVTALVGILRYISSYFLAVRASKTLFKKMLFTVMHAPLRWLDTVPTGRILNRFTADFNIVDERIAMTWSLFFSNLLRMIGICVASCFASVYLVPPALILLGLGVVVGSKYLTVSRPLKRLESNAKSPVFELFNTTLAGLSTIRAFQKTQTYLSQMHRNLDAWTMTTFYIALANRWMSFRMALIAALFSIAVGIVIIVKPIDAALAGLALSFILDFSESLRWMIRCYGDMELEMNSMERAVEYMSLDTEPLDGQKPPAVWPASGSVELKNLEVGYAPDLPPVLKDVSLKIGHGERIGVVGRTGAGKSSLTLALFRFLEARAGSVMIDGLDIAKLDLTDLRSRMSIIPQHPVLFSGTIRTNLDPFGEYTDAQLHEVLARVHLVEPASENLTAPTSDANIFRDLSSPISESGGNLSHGQQQLLCIAQALLADSKIVVLDEATSAIDVATDVLIQRSIRDWFAGRTLIVIAHRLSTIADFDRILVLENGCMAEFDTPRDLWEKQGAFRSMCDSAGDSDELQKIIMEECEEH